MLSKDDIKYMQQAREEIRINRTHTVSLIFQSTVDTDPITGEEIEKEVKFEVDAVVTVISTDRVIRKYMEMGVEYKTGDIIVDVSKDDFPKGEYYEDVYAIEYGGLTYIDIAPVFLGMGELNRYEYLARREV